MCLVALRGIGVADTKLFRTHLQSAGEMYHVGLCHHQPLGTTEAAEGSVGRGIRQAHVAVKTHVGNLVAAITVEQGASHHRLCQVHRVAAIAPELAIERPQFAVWSSSGTILSQEWMASAREPHVHIAVQIDLHGPAQSVGRQSNDRGEGDGTSLLATEATAHALDLADDLAARDAANAGCEFLRLVGRLRRAVDRQLVALTRNSQGCIALKVEVLLPAHANFALDNDRVWHLEGRIDISILHGQYLVLQAVCFDRVLTCDDGLQVRVLHLDQTCAALGSLQGLRHDNSHGLTRGCHLLRTEELLIDVGRAPGVLLLAHVSAGEDLDDTRQSLSSGGVDGQDLRMAALAEDEYSMQRSWDLGYVVRVLGLARALGQRRVVHERLAHRRTALIFFRRMVLFSRNRGRLHAAVGHHISLTSTRNGPVLGHKALSRGSLTWFKCWCRWQRSVLFNSLCQVQADSHIELVDVRQCQRLSEGRHASRDGFRQCHLLGQLVLRFAHCRLAPDSSLQRRLELLRPDGRGSHAAVGCQGLLHDPALCGRLQAHANARIDNGDVIVTPAGLFE
mmetsp:Transcript_65013/g.152107  ORF Transcript_65013/g.152107 Transcript_65013/m.152107 type:complete len:564 (+) Transcript_65013:1202-2893(+)